MERAFIVTKESEYYKELDIYFELQKQQKKFINKYFDEKGIEAKAYIVGGNGSVNSPFEEWQKGDIRLRIEATENDMNKFGKMLCKPGEIGLRQFKVNSEIGKDFAQRCIDEQVTINLHEPWVRDYFNSLSYVGFGLRRFSHKDTLYLKVNSDYLTESDTPEGFTEIKLSEFYSVLEEFEKDIEEEN